MANVYLLLDTGDALLGIYSSFREATKQVEEPAHYGYKMLPMDKEGGIAFSDPYRFMIVKFPVNADAPVHLGRIDFMHYVDQLPDGNCVCCADKGDE